MSESVNGEYTPWHYIDGRWIAGADPVSAAWTEDTEDSVFYKPGYRQLFSVENRFDAGFTVWEHKDRSRHVIATGTDECTRFFYVGAAPDARDICARRATLARDQAITAFIEDVLGGGDLAVIETIVRRAGLARKQGRT